MTILKQAEAGTPVAELCREHGMSNASFYKWRSQFRRSAQGLQDSYSDYLGKLTYRELNSEDYAKVSQIVANTSADKWDYAIEGYAKSQNIGYQEAKDRFALAININQAADIAGIIYGLKGSEGGKSGISSSAASSLKQLMTKYDEFKQNIVSSTKGSNDALAMAGAGSVKSSSMDSGLSSNTHLSTGSGGKGNPIPVPESTKAKNGLSYQSNPKHTPGTKDFGGSRAGIEPKNSLELFESSISISGGKKRFSMDIDGNIHQFMSDGSGSYHWAGSSADKRNPLSLDNKIKSELRKQEGWKIK